MSVEQDDARVIEQTGGLHEVGQRLAAERRQQQREVAAVANALHLRPEVVEAIEAGDEQRLPANAFVRGYVKSYARFLGLDEEEMATLMPVAEVSRPVPLKRVGMRRRTLNLPIGKWLIWAVAMLLVAAVIVYGVPFVERIVNRSEQPVAGDALPLPLDGDDSPVLQALPDLMDEDAAAEEEAPAEEGAVDEPVDEGAAEVVEAAEAVESTEVVEAGEVVEAAPEAAPEPPRNALPGSTVSAGPAEITLQFSQDSWVEMESNGRKLIVGTQSAGSERTIRAEPPISILLGNAPGVVILYRGERIDLEPYQRGKVARLVLEN